MLLKPLRLYEAGKKLNNNNTVRGKKIKSKTDTDFENG